MRHDDPVTVALQGDYGKPRLAMIIQANQFEEHTSVTMLSITNTLMYIPLLRNAVAESFFATLKFELINRRVFASRQAARTMIFESTEVFYNRQRIHQTLGYRTPLEVEENDQTVA